ncbi:4949_t:CDS:2 [Ambispora gerdemannii]|uniref:4949_t:CDS:1 n=1 Tax=Ambispora gerdemannii TaxID=144530 RepID=A0A9N9CM19_9GLOM|nr:4949_t:CDS:2 [Ambispora gerdemannii]
MAGSTLWRNTVWTLFGLRDYTKSGYERNSKKFNKNALNADLTEKVAIVTGANSGLGKYVATELYRRNATVYMLCRDITRGEQARKDIIKEVEEIKVEGLDSKVKVNETSLKLRKVDISDLKNVREFVESLKNENDGKCHILVNNAGVMNQKREFTSYDVETNFACNTLGTYYLTKLMFPLMQKTGPGARIIIVSSGGMYTNKLDVEDLQFEKLNPFDGTTAYAQNKRQQVELTEYWSKKYPEPETGVKFVALHPGWSDTPGVSTSMETFYRHAKSYLRSIPQGCDTILWSAFSEEAEKVPSGSFIFDREVVPTHLPLAKTRSKPVDVEKLVNEIEKYITIGLEEPSAEENFASISS